MPGNIWDKYGQWDQVGSSGDFEHIKDRIVGSGVSWKPNYFPPEVQYVFLAINIANAASERPVTAVDFGCGLGRNGDILKRHFPRVVGVDLPQMISAYRSFYYRKTPVYDEVYEDLDELLSKESINILYDSVVFQHIVDEDYLRAVFAKLLSSRSFSTIVSVRNSALPASKSPMMNILQDNNWVIMHENAERLSFDGIPHDTVVLRRGYAGW